MVMTHLKLMTHSRVDVDGGGRRARVGVDDGRRGARRGGWRDARRRRRCVRGTQARVGGVGGWAGASTPPTTPTRAKVSQSTSSVPSMPPASMVNAWSIGHAVVAFAGAAVAASWAARRRGRERARRAPGRAPSVKDDLTTTTSATVQEKEKTEEIVSVQENGAERQRDDAVLHASSSSSSSTSQSTSRLDVGGEDVRDGSNDDAVAVDVVEAVSMAVPVVTVVDDFIEDIVASIDDEWEESYYPVGYDEPYDAVPSTSAPLSEKAAKKRAMIRKKRREQRMNYFSLMTSKPYGSSASERAAFKHEFEQRCAAPEPIEWLFDTADGSARSKALYGIGISTLANERVLLDIAGDGAFSDVFTTKRNPKATTSTLGIKNAVLKCSNPYPGVVNGQRMGDGYHAGAVESKTLASMPPHPAVVRVLAAFLEHSRNESFLLLSDAGKDMHTMRERGELTPHQVRMTLRRVLQGIAHCHSHGVVHRDIKAGNILLNEPPANARVKSDHRATLIDFGVAKQAMIEDEYVCDMYGTPGYQAPEMLLSDMDVPHDVYAKVDMFSFGVTAFFLCAGFELFGAQNVGQGRADTKVKKNIKRTFWSPEDKSTDDDGDTSDDDEMILRSMLQFDDFNLNAAHEARYRERFGGRSSRASVDGDTNVPASGTLREYVVSVVRQSQPLAFAQMIADCVAYDASARPPASECLASYPDAWRGVVDDDDIEDFLYSGGGIEVCYLVKN